ncbi:hypothetical protein IFM47457_08527 [Aspergillus lentulus]|nr:hypothetical protein IFM47457_08527 [Aspergillus lentulus]
MTSQSTSISLIATLCGLLTLNIYTLLPFFISIPPSLDLRLSTLYVLALQGLISLAVIRLFYIATRCPFRLRCRKTLILMLLLLGADYGGAIAFYCFAGGWIGCSTG